MGFEVTGSTALLDFGQGTLLEGAKVRVSLDMRIRDFLALQRTISSLDADGEALEQWEQIYRQFADTALKSWDLEEDGTPIPADSDGFLSLPFKVANELLKSWMQAIGGVSPNSNAVSESGDTSEAVSEMTAAA